jgi:hypothetical protein
VDISLFLTGTVKYPDISISSDGYQTSIAGASANLLHPDASTFESGIYSWVRYGTNNVTNDNKTLKVEYVDNVGGAYQYWNGTQQLSEDLTVGATYKVSGRTKITGTSVDILNSDGITTYTEVIVKSTDWIDFSYTFVAQHAVNCFIRFNNMGAGEIIWIDDLVIQEVYPTNIKYPKVQVNGQILNNFAVFVLNLENLARSEYTDYNFESFTTFHGKRVGVIEGEGIYELIGDKDVDTDIDAVIELPLSDFNAAELKRLTDLYLGGKFAGNMTIRNIMDQEVESKDYQLRANGDVGLITKKLNLARGHKSRYWATRISNKNGSDFQLDAIEYVLYVARRRKQ